MSKYRWVNFNKEFRPLTPETTLYNLGDLKICICISVIWNSQKGLVYLGHFFGSLTGMHQSAHY